MVFIWKDLIMNLAYFKKYWFELYFPFILLGILILMVIFLFLFSIGYFVFISVREKNYDYRIEIAKGNYVEKFYLNEDEFELKDGYIKFDKDGGTYFLNNFKISKLKK